MTIRDSRSSHCGMSAIASAALVFVVACSSGEPAPNPTSSTVVAVSSSSAPPASSTTSSSTTTLTVVESDFDAEAVVLALAAAGLPIDDYTIYTAANDPNELLGRPGGYTSKVNFHDSRLDFDSEFGIDFGGSVEAFANTGESSARSDYVDAITSGSGLFSEYHWQEGRVFLRVSPSLTPDAADEYQKPLGGVVAALTSGEEPPPLAAPEEQPPGATDPVDPLASPFLDGNASPMIPDGTSGNLEVVLTGPYTSSLPVVIRNRTPEAVLRIEVSAVARSAQGSILVTGSDQGLNPNLVGPGEIAFGYIYFDGEDLPEDVEFEFTVAAEPADGEFADFENIRDLVPASHTTQGDRISGEFTNPHPERVDGPIEVSILCFTPNGSEIVDYYDDFTDQDFVAPDGVLPFSVRLSSACPTYLLAASGFAS